MTIYKAELITRHFIFECFDMTEKGALQTIKKGLLTHFQGDEYQACKFLRDVEVHTMELGKAYRDRESI